MHMKSLLCSAANAICSDKWFNLFKVLTAIVEMLSMLSYLKNLTWYLSFVADFRKTRDRAQTSVERLPYLLTQGRCSLDIELN